MSGMQLFVQGEGCILGEGSSNSGSDSKRPLFEVLEREEEFHSNSVWTTWPFERQPILSEAILVKRGNHSKQYESFMQLEPLIVCSVIVL